MSDPNAGEESPKKSRKGLMLVIAAVVVLGGAAGGWFVFAGNGGEKAEAKPVEEVKLPPQFVALDPPFVVNFQPGSSARFLQVAVQVMTRDAQMVAQLEHLSPVIRNDLLMLFGNKQVAEVSTPEGKEGLRSATLEAVRRIVAEEHGKPDAVEAVYFTSFVMQ